MWLGCLAAFPYVHWSDSSREARQVWDGDNANFFSIKPAKGPLARSVFSWVEKFYVKEPFANFWIIIRTRVVALESRAPLESELLRTLILQGALSTHLENKNM